MTWTPDDEKRARELASMMREGRWNALLSTMPDAPDLFERALGEIERLNGALDDKEYDVRECCDRNRKRANAAESECERLRARVAELEAEARDSWRAMDQIEAEDDERIATLEAALRQIRPFIFHYHDDPIEDREILDAIDAALGEGDP